MVLDHSPSRTQVVDTAGGPVRGLVRDGMQQFLGIPYAAPPVGDLRWRPPAPVTRWTEVLDTVAFGDVCAQVPARLPAFAHASEAEDCLYLNVFTPLRANAAGPLPVMVWLPGGGLYCGGSTGYDPRALVVDGDVVVVSINYRLNFFGFFSHPEINAEDHAAGNYGIMDQQFALHWVRSNIERFGGDPGNVTIFGESAGGISVLAQMAAPGSAGLFHRAIIQSCGPAPVIPIASLGSNEHVGVALATAAGVSDQKPASLRALSTRELMAADGMAGPPHGAGKHHIGLVVDGETVPEPLVDLFATGRFHRVPVINGVNRDEFAFFQAMTEFNTGRVISAEEYPQVVAATLAAAPTTLLGTRVPSDALPEVLARYPCSSFPTPARALAAIVGDCGFISGGGRRATRMLGEFVPAVYAYEWDVPDSPVAWPEVSFPYGSAHVQEIQYLFPGFHGSSGTPNTLSGAQQGLARQMVGYWTEFARTGNPNGADLQRPHWPAYGTRTDNFLSLRLPEPTVLNNFGATHHCDFWDAVDEASTRSVAH